jgi:hypothetical protein
MYLANVDTTNVRDWRRRGLLDGIGVPNPDGLTGRAHWRYRLGDIVALFVVGWFARRGDDLADAAEISSWLREPLVALARRPENRTERDLALVQHRWCVFYKPPPMQPPGPSSRGRLNAIQLKSLRELETNQHTAAYDSIAAYTLIDLHALASEMPAQLVEAIQERYQQ